MMVVVRSKDVNLRIPVPMGMASLAVKVIPEAAFRQMRRDVPPPYDVLITRQVLVMLLDECMDILKENKGLEVICRYEVEQRRFTVTMHSPLAVHSNGLPPEVYDPGGLYTPGGIFRLKIIIKTSLVIPHL